MKILKYLLLLIVLTVIALSVYIATQSGTYEVSRSQTVDAPKDLVFNYVNDLKLWQDWQPWTAEDSSIAFSYSQMTKGDTASFSWKGQSSAGLIQNTKIFAKDSIFQNYTQDNHTAQSQWKFETENKITKLTWILKGEMSFVMKVSSFFYGGADAVLSPQMELSLKNIATYFSRELGTFDIDTQGVVSKEATYYIQQKGSSTSQVLIEDLEQITSSLLQFVAQNALVQNGKPFVIFERATAGQPINYWVTVPITEEIFTTEDSQVKGGRLEAFPAFRTVLNGDYSHIDQALIATREALKESHQGENTAKNTLMVLEKSIIDTHKPSQWITAIYLPLTEIPAAVVRRTAPTPPVVNQEQTVETN